MTFAARLKSHRDSLRWNQSQMARALDLSVRAYNYYESGERTPHVVMQEGIFARIKALGAGKRK